MYWFAIQMRLAFEENNGLGHVGVVVHEALDAALKYDLLYGFHDALQVVHSKSTESDRNASVER